MPTNLRVSLAGTLVLATFGLAGCAGGVSGEPTWNAGDDGGGDASDLPPYLGDDGSSPGPTSYEAGGGGDSSGGSYVDSSSGGYPNGGSSSGGNGSSSSGGGSSGGGSSSGGKYNCGIPVCSFDQNSPPDCGCTWTDSNGSLHLWGCVPNVACGCYNIAHTFAPSAGPYSAGQCADTASASKAALQACCN